MAIRSVAFMKSSLRKFTGERRCEFVMKQDERGMELKGDNEGKVDGYVQEGMRWMEVTEKISDKN